MKNKRMQNVLRKNMLLQIGLDLAKHHGYTNVSKYKIADKADVSPSLVAKVLGTAVNMRRDIMRYAIKNQCLSVMAQGMVLRDPKILKLDCDTKNLIFNFIKEQ